MSALWDPSLIFSLRRKPTSWEQTDKKTKPWYISRIFLYHREQISSAQWLEKKKKAKCLNILSVSASFRAFSHLNFELHNFSNFLKYKSLHEQYVQLIKKKLAFAKIKYVPWNPHFRGLLIFSSCAFCGDCMNCLWQRSGSRVYDSVLLSDYSKTAGHISSLTAQMMKKVLYFALYFVFVVIFIVTTPYLSASSHSKQFRFFYFKCSF